MNAEELKNRISKLSIWKQGGVRAPHKPLLILYALGRLQDHSSKLLSYEDVRNKLKDLLKEFGPKRKSYHPEEPFIRLTKDGIWRLSVNSNSVNYSDKWLLTNGIHGGFNEDIYSLLINDDNLVRDIAVLVLNEHFPETLHEDILTAVGLNIERGSKRIRDASFRDRILQAYEYSCAVCGFNVRLGHTLVAVEAAHIKWHQAGGPDREENGIALCAMHHKLFDRGVFTINQAKELIVSSDVHGNGSEEWLKRYHGQQIRTPIHPEYQPSNTFINWHIREVFRGPGRYRVS
ncbi:MAG: phosphorothioated DNA-binding restriction endonuclease [Carboxydocellales bacterium]